MEALGYIGEQLQSHVGAAAQVASQRAEKSLFDMSDLKLSAEEKKIYDCLDHEPTHIEQVVADTDLAPGTASAGLISLRLKGLIKQLPGSLFLRR